MKIESEGGWGITSKQVMCNPNLSPQAKALYALLATYADYKTRECFPGRRRLAEDLGVSERTIGTLLAALADAGVVERQGRGWGRNRQSKLRDFIFVVDD